MQATKHTNPAPTTAGRRRHASLLLLACLPRLLLVTARFLDVHAALQARQRRPEAGGCDAVRTTAAARCLQLEASPACPFPAEQHDEGRDRVGAAGLRGSSVSQVRWPAAHVEYGSAPRNSPSTVNPIQLPCAATRCRPPSHVCVFAFTSTKLTSLDGKALDNLQAAVRKIAGGECARWAGIPGAACGSAAAAQLLLLASTKAALLLYRCSWRLHAGCTDGPRVACILLHAADVIVTDKPGATAAAVHVEGGSTEDDRALCAAIPGSLPSLLPATRFGKVRAARRLLHVLHHTRPLTMPPPPPTTILCRSFTLRPPLLQVSVRNAGLRPLHPGKPGAVSTAASTWPCKSNCPGSYTRCPAGCCNWWALICSTRRICTRYNNRRKCTAWQWVCWCPI